MEEIKNKKDAIRLINILIKSCKEGIDGSWDCSTKEGKEGFDDMILLLEEIKKFVKIKETI